MSHETAVTDISMRIDFTHNGFCIRKDLHFTFQMEIRLNLPQF